MRFKSVLSEGEAATIAEEIGFFDGSDELFLLFAHKLEQAVLAKLHEQEPVAWLILDADGDIDCLEHFCHGDKPSMASKFKQPLYAHPCVSPAIDKPTCVSENRGGDTQKSKRHNWDDAGERCLDCGDKDWFAGLKCSGKSPSPTKGMSLGERIAHVGGRENKNGYIEFGSVMAVHALISHVIRDKCGNCQGNLDNSTQVHRNLVKQLAYKYGVKQGSDELNDGIYAFANEIASLLSSVTLFDNEAKNHTADSKSMVGKKIKMCDLEGLLFKEMDRRFDLSGEENQYERLPIDDTQLGVEFAFQYITKLMRESDHIPDAGQMISDGWQLTPTQATNDMYMGFCHVRNDIEPDEFREAYRAMLEAAPKPTL